MWTHADQGHPFPTDHDAFLNHLPDTGHKHFVATCYCHEHVLDHPLLYAHDSIRDINPYACHDFSFPYVRRNYARRLAVQHRCRLEY
ncbi:hypothetical protein H0H87_008640 [Tephrocybe sp. NHM501043]|nr:hypothetical protein H0H87_008640 [Tephrocybe sp. NHM501043]